MQVGEPIGLAAERGVQRAVLLVEVEQLPDLLDHLRRRGRLFVEEGLALLLLERTDLAEEVLDESVTVVGGRHGEVGKRQKVPA